MESGRNLMKLGLTANKHTRCDPSRPNLGVDGQAGKRTCKQCVKDGVPCTQTRSRIRFSDVSGRFATQTEGITGTGAQTQRKLVYIDETPELAASYGQEDDNMERSTATRVGNAQLEVSSTLAMSPSMDGNWNVSTPGGSLSDNRANQHEGHEVSAPLPEQSDNSAESTSFVMRGLVKPPCRSSLSLNQSTLDMWLDLCDPDRHFQLVVPQRARYCLPLMNAILAASARHLTRVPKNRTASGAVNYDGRILHDLTDETALHYHNKCIHDLLKLGANTEQTRNEDLLAAAIILRFYEEVDYPLQDEKRDNELFLRVINMFIDAQIPNVPLGPHSTLPITGSTSASSDFESTALSAEFYTSPSASTPRNAVESKRWYMADLRQAAFWVAFRQEVYSAFLKQRPFNMSLSRCDVFRSFSPAEDALWTARLVIFCADVLEFCYGSAQHPRHETANIPTKERWTQLKNLSKKWVDLLPSSFEPIYFREPDQSKAEVFPEICYLTNVHVAGVQHVELARILLAVYDPNIPKLGFGHRASMRALSLQLRASVLRLCGIAVHNRKNPPSLTTALLGIVVCGEHFDDLGEQTALLGLLDELEYDLGWPVGNYRDRLRESWGHPI
ncbi:hypothetical protein BDW59DRAFT_175948 [Aspergillus cavernicola]|uniref:Zn(II)2Cys6 transcription factor n=1 Tax=Aspergillus cavernicola TaxID=176166 RepID=A0ABR4HKU8_9EURO